MKLRLLLVAVTLLLLSSAVWAQDSDSQMIVNPQFVNSPDPVKPSNDTFGDASLQKIPVGSGDLAGWTVERGSVYVGGTSGQREHFLLLEDYGTVSQYVATTPGRQYELTFWMLATISPPTQKDITVAYGDQQQTFIQHGDQQAERFLQHRILFTAKSKRTRIQFSTSMHGHGHHMPVMSNVSMTLYDPSAVSVSNEITACYSNMYSGRTRRDFNTAFSYLSPDYERITLDGQRLDRGAFQASIRTPHFPEGYPGVTTYEIHSVKPIAGSKDVAVVLTERYSYSRMMKDHQIHPIVWVTLVNERWTPGPKSWLLLASREVQRAFYIDMQKVDSIP